MHTHHRIVVVFVAYEVAYENDNPPGIVRDVLCIICCMYSLQYDNQKHFVNVTEKIIIIYLFLRLFRSVYVVYICAHHEFLTTIDFILRGCYIVYYIRFNVCKFIIIKKQF